MSLTKGPPSWAKKPLVIHASVTSARKHKHTRGFKLIIQYMNKHNEDGENEQKERKNPSEYKNILFDPSSSSLREIQIISTLFQDAIGNSRCH